MAALATSTDLVTRYDIDVIADLAGDSRTQILRNDVLAHDSVLTALKSGSGEVEVAIKRGKRYTADHLANLEDNSRELLKDIVCACAMAWLFERRPGIHNELAERIREKSVNRINRLANGVDVLGIINDTSHQDASLPKESGPTSLQIESRNFLSSRMSQRHLPSVEERNPIHRG